MENSHEDYTTICKGTQMVILKIDPEFRDKIPKPKPEEVEQLEKNILRDGRITDPIFTWHGFIVDGHTRYGIMQKHPDIDFKPTIIALDDMFSDRDEVIVWMCERQTGRRNITKQQRKMLADTAYEAICRLRGGNGSNQYVAKNPTGSFAKSPAEQIADQFKMSVPHVKHAIRFGRGVKAIEEKMPGATDELMSGQSNVSDATVESFPSVTEEEQDEIIAALIGNRKPERKPNKPRPRKPKTEEEKRDMAEIEAIVADMYDPTTVPEFTIDMLIEDIEFNAQLYIDLLRNTLADRSNLVTDENKPRIAAAIDNVVENIMKVRENL